MRSSILWLFSTFICNVSAHPGGDTKAELQRRTDHLDSIHWRSLHDCKAQLEEDGYYRQRLAKRLHKANLLRADQGHAPSV